MILSLNVQRIEFISVLQIARDILWTFRHNVQMFYVYALLIEDQIFYVGKASMKHRRFNAHMSQARRGNPTRTYRKMAKALEEGKPITMKPLQINLTESQAFELEQQLIKLYGRADQGLGPLTNHTDGGEGSSGHKHTAEARKKIGQASRTRPIIYGYHGGGRPAKKITVVELDGTPIKSYPTLAALQRETKKSKNAIYHAVTNQGQTELWGRKVRIITAP